MKSTKISASILTIIFLFSCVVLFTSNTSIKKTNSEQIKALAKKISNLQNKITSLELEVNSKNELGSDVYIAEIVLFGGNFAPRGYMDCNGQLLPISQYSALFALLGTTYGGDGRTTFGLPKLNKKINGKLNQPRYIIAVQGVFPSRS